MNWGCKNNKILFYGKGNLKTRIIPYISLMKQIRILFLEDKQQDFDLAVAQLEKSGMPFKGFLTGDKKDFQKALRTFRPDVIIVECLLPRFNGIEALQLCLEHDDTIPVIIFSDLTNDQLITNCIEAGATDFVHKEHLARLPFSITEALKLHTSKKEKQQAEEKLQKERDIFLTIANTSPIGKTIVDRDGVITYVNRKGAEILGYSADEIRTRSYNSPNWKITDADGNPLPDEQLHFRQVKRTGNPVFEVEHAISWPDGRRVLLSINASPLFDRKGEFDGMVATLNDVTGIKRAEMALFDSERKYRLLFEKMMNGFALHEIVLDPEGKPVDYIFLEANKAFMDLTRTSKAIIGKRVTEVIPGIESDPADWIGLYGRVAMQDKEYRFEQFSRELKRWFSVYAFSPQQGQFVTVFEEITARKEGEDKLRESEQHFRELFENMSSGMATYKAVDGGKDFLFTSINRAGETLDGVDRRQLLGESVLETFPAVREFGLFDVFRRVWETGQAERLAEAHYKDERISCWRNNFVYKLQSGEIVAIYDDITDLVESRKRLEESEGKFSGIFQNAADGIVYVHRNGTVEDVNPTLCKMLEIPREELVGKQITFLIAKLLKSNVLPLLMKNINAVFSRKFIKPFQINYKEKIFDISTPFHVGQDHVTGIIRDVTEKKQNEIRMRLLIKQLTNLTDHIMTLRENEKKAVAREIHDDLGQKLTAIKMDLDWMVNNANLSGQHLKKIADIKTILKESMEWTHRIIRELRPPVLDDLGFIEAVRWLGNDTTKKFSLKVSVDVDNDELMMPKEQELMIFRVLQEAMTNIGYHAKATQSWISVKNQPTELTITIRDDGKGITRKQMENPLSFGLMGMKERVSMCNGSMEIEGEADKGTTVSVTIPKPFKP